MVFEKIQQIIADKLEIDKAQITRDTKFTDDLELNSLDVAELVMEIEAAFDITIPDEAYMNITPVGDAVDEIENAKG